MAYRALTDEMREVLERQRRRLERLQRGRPRRLLLDALRRTRTDLQTRIAGLGMSGQAPYTLHQHRIVLAQVETAMLRLARDMRNVLDEATQAAMQQSIQDAIEQVAIAAKEYGLAEISIPLEEAQKLVAGDSRLREIEERRLAEGVARYGRDGVTMMERELVQALLAGETVDAATRRITGRHIMVDRYWKAERLVRTEFAHAYNAAARTALDAVARKERDLWLMWDEHADGPTWGGPGDKPWPGPARPLDDRTAPDSLRLHGQLRRPGQAFIDPLTGQRYMFPPNRPNDRATLTVVMARQG